MVNLVRSFFFLVGLQSSLADLEKLDLNIQVHFAFEHAGMCFHVVHTCKFLKPLTAFFKMTVFRLRQF